MKQICLFVGVVAVAIFMVNCGGKKNSENKDSVLEAKETEVLDSTFYGVCGSGTSMHSLELITDQGDTLNYLVNNEDDTPTIMG